MGVRVASGLATRRRVRLRFRLLDLVQRGLARGLARYFNSSVDEIDVFILQSNAREIKLDDFRGSMASLSGGKKDKLGLNMLKRAIKFRRV